MTDSAVIKSGAICSTAAMLASCMCASAAMNPAVERPSQSERHASTRLIAVRNCCAYPNAAAAAPINSAHMTPRTKMTWPIG